jgi:hypothetical protein
LSAFAALGASGLKRLFARILAGTSLEPPDRKTDAAEQDYRTQRASDERVTGHDRQDSTEEHEDDPQSHVASSFSPFVLPNLLLALKHIKPWNPSAD